MKKRNSVFIKKSRAPSPNPSHEKNVLVDNN